MFRTADQGQGSSVLRIYCLNKFMYACTLHVPGLATQLVPVKNVAVLVGSTTGSSTVTSSTSSATNTRTTSTSRSSSSTGTTNSRTSSIYSGSTTTSHNHRGEGKGEQRILSHVYDTVSLATLEFVKDIYLEK